MTFVQINKRMNGHQNRDVSLSKSLRVPHSVKNSTSKNYVSGVFIAYSKLVGKKLSQQLLMPITSLEIEDDDLKIKHMILKSIQKVPLITLHIHIPEPTV